mgnify:CR=1 FL=1
MQSLNFIVIETLNKWLALGDCVYLVTIVETWGASPRPPGSLFAYNRDKGFQVGSLSGGCIEDDLIGQLCGGHIDSRKPVLKYYGDSDEQRKKFELPCGGRLQLVIELILPEVSSQSHFATIQSQLADRQKVYRELSLTTGESDLCHDDILGSLNDSPVCLTESHFSQRLSPEYQLLIVGSGEISRYLADIIQSVEFTVTVCEPRINFITRTEECNHSYPLIHCLPDDLVFEKFNDEYSAIVALAHDPRVDDLAIIAGLESQAFYVGAMGSKLTSEKRVQRLQSLGISNVNIQKLHAPIGININSKTPPEIAISIASHLIQVRHQHVNCS